MTEFLPVSSTAHLTIAGKALGLVSQEHPEAWTAFIAVMQLGTLAAVLLYFRRDILAMIVSVFRDLGAAPGWKLVSPASQKRGLRGLLCWARCPCR